VAADKFSAFCPAYNRLRDRRHAETDIMNVQRRQKLFGQQQRRMRRVEENFAPRRYYTRYEKKKRKKEKKKQKRLRAF